MYQHTLDLVLDISCDYNCMPLNIPASKRCVCCVFCLLFMVLLHVLQLGRPLPWPQFTLSHSCFCTVLCPKSCIIELKACMGWAALSARSWGGRTNPQAGHTAPDPQTRWIVIKKRLDLHLTAHKYFLSPVSSHTKWLHRDLDRKNVRCSVMVRMAGQILKELQVLGRRGRSLPLWCTE